MRIPKSVTVIGSGAFTDCNKLHIKVEAESKPAGWDEKWQTTINQITVDTEWGVK